MAGKLYTTEGPEYPKSEYMFREKEPECPKSKYMFHEPERHKHLEDLNRQKRLLRATSFNAVLIIFALIIRHTLCGRHTVYGWGVVLLSSIGLALIGLGAFLSWRKGEIDLQLAWKEWKAEEKEEEAKIRCPSSPKGDTVN